MYFIGIHYCERQYLRNVIFTECKGKLITGKNIHPRDVVMLVDMVAPVQDKNRIHILKWKGKVKADEDNIETNNDTGN